MDELNPNHPVTNEMRQQWHKLCALVMFKLGASTVQITAADLESFSTSDRTNIMVHPHGDVITLALVSDAQAARLARQEGGLPV